MYMSGIASQPPLGPLCLPALLRCKITENIRDCITFY